MWARPITYAHITNISYINCPYCTGTLHNYGMLKPYHNSQLNSHLGRTTLYTTMICKHEHMFILAGKYVHGIQHSTTAVQLYEICTDDMLNSVTDMGIWRWYIARSIYKRQGIRAKYSIAGGKMKLNTELYD